MENKMSFFHKALLCCDLFSECQGQVCHKQITFLDRQIAGYLTNVNSKNAIIALMTWIRKSEYGNGFEKVKCLN